VSDRDVDVTASIRLDRFTGSVRRDRFLVTIGANVPRTINITAGGIEYVIFDLAETSGADITGAVVQVSLGDDAAPGAWLTPDSVTHPTSSTATVKLLVGGAYVPTVGRHYGWVRLTDSPEVVPVRCGTSIVIK
jgi:hypothetical protein